MGRGRWSRWGRGSCEGYSLEFGFLYRFDIRPGPRSNGPYPDHWSASASSTSLGRYPSFEEAAEACEAEARRLIEAAIARGETGGDMRVALDHWNAFLALPRKHRPRVQSGRRR
ncbi:MAG: hypothetical protein ABUL55_01710 [Pseudomonadota bacterium]